MVIKYKHGDFMIEHTVDSYRKLFAFIKDISDTLHWEPLAGVFRRSPRWWRATWWRIRAAVRRWQWLKGGR